MLRTDEQVAADKALDEAIHNHRRAWMDALHEDPSKEIIQDWILVSAFIRYDDDGDQMVGYHFAMPNDQLTDHRAKGLLHHAIDLLNDAE